jgi:hypothetical protein
VDLDLDCVGSAVAGDFGGTVGLGTAVLRLQRDLGGADVLALQAGADQRVDDRLLTVIRLVHRGGDVGCGELDSDAGGQGVRDALDLPRTQNRHLTRIRPGRRLRGGGIAPRQRG